MTAAPTGGRCAGKNRHRGGYCGNIGFHLEDGKWYCDHHIPKVDSFWRDRKAKMRKVASARATVMKRWRKKHDDIIEKADIACRSCGEKKSTHAKIDGNGGLHKTPSWVFRCYRKESTWKGRKRVEERVLSDHWTYSRNWEAESEALDKAGFTWTDAHKEADAAADMKRKELGLDGEEQEEA